MQHAQINLLNPGSKSTGQNFFSSAAISRSYKKPSPWPGTTRTGRMMNSNVADPERMRKMLLTVHERNLGDQRVFKDFRSGKN